MKGYAVLILVTVGLFLLLPVCFLREQAIPTPTATQPTEAASTFTVRHGDEQTVSSVEADVLTRYAVMGTLAPDAPDEAIKAQAVACYTAFCYAQQHDGEVRTALPYPDAFDDAYWKEKWGEGFEKHAPRFQKAIDAVRGERLTYQGEPILAAYHALNTGKTESAKTVLGEAVPYLKTVGSPLDATAPEQLSTVTVSQDEAKKTLKTLCATEDLGEAATWFGEPKKSEAGTVLSVTVCGTKQTGAAVQQAFSLPSAAFDVCVQGNEVIFTVHGRGHFLGMSVYGATTMADGGNTYKEILRHYYPDTELKKG